MKIVITGASGYVGKNIVPELKGKCESLLLVGRDLEKLGRMFPGVPNCSFEEMRVNAIDFDAIIHLSVLNNKTIAKDSDFNDVNVILAKQTAHDAAACGIKKFYNISSVHVLDNQNQSQYAKSKRDAVSHLRSVSGIEIIDVYLPFVRGAQWNGKLAFLNKTPSLLAKPLRVCLLALKPSVTADRLARFVLQPSDSQDMIILAEGQSKNVIYKAVKRGIDLLFAVAVIDLLWWALLIVWALVRFSSPGPGIFAQERVGLQGKTFTCYKFRTMRKGTVQAGTHEVSHTSVTPIGRFLRGTKLDELPQVWNILKNEISLIGPRPGLPAQRELFCARQVRGVFEVKPGISGLAQVNDIDMSNPMKLAEVDANYVLLRSLELDIKIIYLTIRGGGQGDKVSIT